MWRDFADYFTLPALWGGLDRLLAHALGLRLLPPQHTQQDQAWGPGVWHLQLWDTRPPALHVHGRDSSSGTSGTIRNSSGSSRFDSWVDPAQGGGFWEGSSGGGGRNGWWLLGDVFIQVCPPGSFPFTSLLRPTTCTGAWGWDQPPDAGGYLSVLSSSQKSRCASDGQGGHMPGAVVIHLPLALSVSSPAETPTLTPPTSSKSYNSSGIRSSSSNAFDPSGATDPAPPGRPPALRSPFGLRALLHETGHAVALLATGAAAPHPLLAATAGAGGGGSIEMRELPSHFFEGWARDPRSLALLSCHWRLGVPLPPRDAAKLARYAFSAAACSAVDLHEGLLLAMVDARLHGGVVEQGGREGGLASSGEADCEGQMMGNANLSSSNSSSGASSGGCGASGSSSRASSTGGHPETTDSRGVGDGGGASSRLCSSEALFDAVWSQHGVLPGNGTTLESVRGLEALGTVGGARWGYAVARLLAAAAWKRWFEEDPLCPAAGQEVKERLLYGLGRGLVPQLLLSELLGEGAVRRVDVDAEGAQKGLQRQGVERDDGGVRDGMARERRCCWMPDLYHSAFQDVDLLG